MTMMNTHYGELKASYLFRTIDAKVAAFRQANPGAHLLRLGIGDVTQPLAPAVIEALHGAVVDQARAETFRGYMPEVGADFLKEAIAGYYAERGVALDPAEIFVSSGASDDLGDVLDIFARGIAVALIEPAYPAYLDANVMAGNRIVHVEAVPEEAFAPLPPAGLQADVVYLCSPNNPTGAVFSRGKLAAWVAWARAAGAIIIFDAAYEAFVQDEGIPHSIFEIPGAEECTIEVCSLSKTAGFTGTRCGWTVVPKALVRDGFSLRDMWTQDRTTRTNGVSYVLQRAGEAALSPAGLRFSRESIAVYQENGRILSEALRAAGLWFTGGRNAPYLWLPCPGGQSGWAFFEQLLGQAQIVVTPGEGFGEVGAGYVRLSCFGSRGDTEEAARRLLTVL